MDMNVNNQQNTITTKHMKNKIDRPKVFIDLAKDNYVLTRLEDNKQITASVIKFVEWNEDGTGKYVHDDPAIGRSIMADGWGELTYKWMTTPIIEIISETKFKTKNSTYTLHKL
jgi:hypothetical protein